MRPVSVDDLQPSRDFDLRAFVISTLLGTAATVAIWIEQGHPHKSVGPTAATLDDAARFLAFLLSALVIGPSVALMISRRGGRLWTAFAVIPAASVLSILVIVLR
jgi:hypothetical protein